MGKIILSFFLLIFFSGLVLAIYPNSCVFSGKVNTAFGPAPLNLTIRAYVDSTELGSCKTYKGYDNNTWYALIVSNSSDGAIVKFKVDEVIANEYGIFSSGVLVMLNLTFNLTYSGTTTTTVTTVYTTQKTTTTTVREITIIIPEKTTTITTFLTSIPLTTTIQEEKLSTTIIETKAETNKTTPTTIQITKAGKTAVSETDSVINFFVKNSITFLLVIVAFLVGYYISSFKKK
ncbi:MAG: hypothetical protein QW802_03870 [Candidatus Altiarchaeota archaeon]